MSAPVEKVYESLKAYQRGWWLRAFRKQGHTPVKRGGRVDGFAFTAGDYHNGPVCASCGWGCCWHCTPPWGDMPKCDGAARKKRLKREHEDSILAEAAAIRKRRARKSR